jgi:hypothetical protein
MLAQAVGQLRRMMLQVAYIQELMLQFRHFISPEADFGRIQVELFAQRTDRIFAEVVILRNLSLCIRLPDFGRAVRRPRQRTKELIFLAMLPPGAERSLIPVEAPMGAEKRRIRHLPESIRVIVRNPESLRASINGLAQHGRCRVVLVFNNRLYQRHGCLHDSFVRIPEVEESTARMQCLRLHIYPA